MTFISLTVNLSGTPSRSFSENSIVNYDLCPRDVDICTVIANVKDLTASVVSGFSTVLTFCRPFWFLKYHIGQDKFINAAKI